MDLVFPTDRTHDAWHVFLWNLPDDFVNPIQKLQFMLMMHTRFNQLDPIPVVQDLLQNRQLWFAATMDRRSNLIKLRDLPDGRCWNVDTLFLLAHEDMIPQLQKLAETWRADEIGMLSGKETDREMGIGRGTHPHRILTCWWD